MYNRRVRSSYWGRIVEGRYLDIPYTPNQLRRRFGDRIYEKASVLSSIRTDMSVYEICICLREYEIIRRTLRGSGVDLSRINIALSPYA